MNGRGFLLVTFLFSLFVAGAEARPWTSKDGVTVEGRAVKKTDTTVTLELEDGRTVEVLIAKLSPGDRQYLEGWSPKPPKRPIQVPEQAVFHDGSWFHVVLEELRWKRAAQKAEQMGGRLAKIKDAETNEVIVKLAKGLLLWIGATDEEVDGLWKWTDGDEFTFASWGVGEPNGGRAENYVRLGGKGKWIAVDDKGGSNRVVGFIVQWD